MMYCMMHTFMGNLLRLERNALVKVGISMSESEYENNGGRPADQQQTTSSKTQDGPAASEAPGSVDQDAGSDTSERKKRSNQKNAKHSTGPKTDRGKRAVRGNALKHGFYATDAVIGGAFGWEDDDEFIMLHDALKRDWHPQGATEESAVHAIAVADWRLRRGYRSEVGEIGRAAASVVSQEAHNKLEGNPAVAILGFEAQPDQGTGITAAAVEARLLLLSAVRAEVERLGYVSATSQEALDKSFGNAASSLASRCYELSCMVRRQQSSEEEKSSISERESVLRILHPDTFEKGGASAEQCKKLLLRSIDAAIKLGRLVHKDVEERESRIKFATLRAHNVPPREYVEKAVRYEAAQDRKKEKAIKLLLELQERRRKRHE